ncbi:MAG: hypothetical protein ABIJ34_08790 [archaeon]
MIDIFGILLLFVIPGLILARILYPTRSFLEQFISTVLLSILISTVVGLFLGYNQFMARMTGGLTRHNLIVSLLSVSFVLLCILVYKRGLNKTKKR